MKKSNKIDLKSKHNVGNAEIDLNKMIINFNNKSKKLIIQKKILIEMLANRVTYSEMKWKNFCISQERSIDVMITRLEKT